MTMTSKTGYGLVRMGATALFICVLLSGCASQQAAVEPPAPVVVEEAVEAVEVAPAAADGAPESHLGALPAEAGNDSPGMAPDGPESASALPESAQPAATPKKQSKYNPDDVIWIQQRLKDLGYYEGPIDGSVGKDTRNAVMEYQREQDVTADGQPTAELRKFMWLNGG